MGSTSVEKGSCGVHKLFRTYIGDAPVPLTSGGVVMVSDGSLRSLWVGANKYLNMVLNVHKNLTGH